MGNVTVRVATARGGMTVKVGVAGLQGAPGTPGDVTLLTYHTGRTDNPHAVTKAQVGLGFADNTADADKPVSTAQAAADAATLASAGAHADAGDAATLSAANAHSDAGDASTLSAANAHSDAHADAGDVQTLNSANARTDAHAARTDNPHTVTKAQVGLANADDTSDLQKPVSTAQAAADAQTLSQANARTDAHSSRTDNPHAVTKAQVGLGNADDTSDLGKPVSTAQQTAIDAAQSAAQAHADAHATRTDNPHVVTKAQVGLGNADNTSDLAKPVSTAQQAAIDASTSSSFAHTDAHTGRTDNPHAVTKLQVGLGAVDNTADVDKPVSTAQAAADTAVYNNAKNYVDGIKTGLDTAISSGDAATLAQAKTYADGLTVGLLQDCGNYDASSNQFPSGGGSGPAGAIQQGDLWYVSIAGTLGGKQVLVGYSVRALVDGPGQVATNWDILNVGLGYVPENVANKDADGTLAANSDTRYATQKATKTYADGLYASAIQRANHTGTQTASTISDFASVTLAVALTGFASVSAASVTATDSVLTAFEKTQAQITANAAAAVQLSGSYADPAWITSLAASKLVGTTLPANIVSSSLTGVGTIATGVWQGTAITDTYLATISSTGKVSNSATTATALNTASAIVARDASGNFTASTITAALIGNVTGNISGNAGTVTNGVYTIGAYADPAWITSLAGSKISGNISGNAGTVTNGVYTIGAYADPAWITSLAGSKISGNISGNAATATLAANASQLLGVTWASPAAIGSTSPAAGTFTSLRATGDLTVDGNLTVSGSVVQVNTSNVTVTDPLVKYASSNTTDVVDIGFYALYQPAATPLYTGLFRDATDGKYKLFSGLQAEPTTTVNIGGAGYTVASLVANLEGSVTGNATTATTLQTARNINGVSFNGSADITVAAAAGTLTGTALAATVTSASLSAITPPAGTLAVSYGGTQFQVVSAASSVNYLQITGGATNVAPSIIAQGSDTDITVYIGSKGAGVVALATGSPGAVQFRASHTASAVNFFQATGGATGVAATLLATGADANVTAYHNTKGTGWHDFATGGMTQLRVAYTASAVNFVQVTGAATGAFPTISAQGSDSTVALLLQAKGDAQDQGVELVTSTGATLARFDTQTSATTPANLLFRRNTGAARIVVEGGGTNYDLNLEPKGTGAVRVIGPFSAGGVVVNGAITLGTTSSPGIISLESTVTRSYVGDGTGYSWAFSKRTGGVTTDLMTIKDAGRFLFGTTTDDGVSRMMLDGGDVKIQSSGYAFRVGADYAVMFGHSATGMELGSSVGVIKFTKSGVAEYARFDASGNLLVGATSLALSDSSSILFQAQSPAAVIVQHPTGAASASAYAAFSYAGGQIGNIAQNGTTGVAYNTSSDRRLKTNIAAAGDAGSIIDALQVVQYDWLAGGHTAFGFVAQDEYLVYPDAVTPGDDGDNITRTWGRDDSKLVPLLVKEVQSLRARVAQLETIR